jgi:2-iminobutanoate/2-iminopropanoate deaminase
MAKQFIRTPNAPQPIGPYSQGVKAGSFLFVSAQAPIDPKTGKVVSNDIESQTRQVLENVKSIVEAGDLTLNDVVRVTVFLRNAADFQKMNEVYKKYFSESLPARTTVEGKLPATDMLITVDAIAYY